jgi:hypothetical protein
MNDKGIAITNPQQYKRMQDAARLKADQAELDLLRQMETPHGRRYVWGVLQSLLYQQRITDTNASVYGKVAKQAESVGMVLTMKAKCRDLFYLMERENDGL